MTAAGPRMVELADEVADGALMMVGLHPLSIAAARRRLEAGAKRSGRDLSDFKTIYITPMTVDEDGREARRWPQSWFRHDQPYLEYLSDSNLIWLREAGIDLSNDLIPENISDSQAEDICDAFGLFGTGQECLTRLIREGMSQGSSRYSSFQPTPKTVVTTCLAPRWRLSKKLSFRVSAGSSSGKPVS